MTIYKKLRGFFKSSSPDEQDAAEPDTPDTKVDVPKGVYSTQGYSTPEDTTDTKEKPPSRIFTNNPTCQKCGCKTVVQNSGQTISQGNSHILAYFLLTCPKCFTNCMLVGRPVRDQTTGETKLSFISFWCNPRQSAKDRLRLSTLASKLNKHEAHLQQKQSLAELKN